MPRTVPSSSMTLRARCASGKAARPTFQARWFAMRGSCAAASSNAARKPVFVLLTVPGASPLAQEAVAPFAKLGSAQQHDRLVQEHTGQMDARVLRVVPTAAARNQILFVERERFAHGERAAFVEGVAGLTARERPRPVDGLPVVQDGRRARDFE